MKKKILIIGIETVVLIVLLIFVNSKWIEKIPACWVYQTTGLFCPACGGTRCVIYILKGRWIEAFFSHTIFFIGILYFFIINIIYIVSLNKAKKLYPKYWYTIIFAIFLIIYTIIRNLL